MPLTYLEKCHFQTNSDFLISMSNCLKHIDCNDVLMRYFLRFSCHSVQSVKHIDCNHVLMRYFLCFWYILFSLLWMPVTQKASKPESPPTMLEVTIYNNIFRSRDSNLDFMMIYHHTISMPYIQNAKVKVWYWKFTDIWSLSLKMQKCFSYE